MSDPTAASEPEEPATTAIEIVDLDADADPVDSFGAASPRRTFAFERDATVPPAARQPI
jgi:hypothetical protein